MVKSKAMQVHRPGWTERTSSEPHHIMHVPATSASSVSLLLGYKLGYKSVHKINSVRPGRNTGRRYFVPMGKTGLSRLAFFCPQNVLYHTCAAAGTLSRGGVNKSIRTSFSFFTTISLSFVFVFTLIALAKSALPRRIH